MPREISDLLKVEPGRVKAMCVWIDISLDHVCSENMAGIGISDIEENKQETQ